LLPPAPPSAIIFCSAAQVPFAVETCSSTKIPSSWLEIGIRSVGNADEMARFLAAFKEILPAGDSATRAKPG
jgi:hypothetical protein